MIDHPADNELNRIALVLDLAPECLAKNSNVWHEGVPPQMAVLELAKKMLEIDPYLNIYLEDMRSTDAEAAFLAAAIRLGFERFRM